MSVLKKALILVFLLAAGSTVVLFNLSKPRVLVLHSYDRDYSWTRDVNTGLKRVLEQKSHYAVRWFYMDTKRHPWPDYKQTIGAAARRVIDNWKPDVVIAVDDDAQEYVMRHYVNHAGIKIVFAGVNGEAGAYGYDGASNVTGILERKELDFIRDTIVTLAADRPASAPPLRLVHIGDNSESVNSDDRFMHTFDWSPVKLLDSILVETFDQWQQAVNAAPARADFITISNYRKLRRSAQDRSLVPPREVVRWTVDHARLPILGSNGFYVEDGGAFAIGTSPFEQGEVAAQLAAELIEKGTAPATLPFRSTRQFVVYMRGSGIAQNGFKLPRLYESFARATNNYFE